MRRTLLIALFALPLTLLMAACMDDDPDGAPVSATPDPQQKTAEGAPLHEARLDLATRLGIDPMDVTLKSVRAAGFDGCLGVVLPGQACTEQFIGGYIAFYDANGEQHRYHFGGDTFIYADSTKATITDGLEVPGELDPDLNRQLAAYVREDLELRVDDEGAVVTAILPVTFPDGCTGFMLEGHDACDTVIVEGAVVYLVGPDQKTYRYHVSGMYGVIATDFEKGTITFEPRAEERVVQQLMRQDLAQRLSIPVDGIQVVSYRMVTWPDGCLGVYRPDAVCTQALVQGFLALLADPDGKEYRYHGGPDGNFVAASFEPNARIGDPIIPDGE